jgi:hypothetical protein
MSAVATLSSATASQFPMFPIPAALLEARSSVTGTVKDATGRGISNAEVVVVRDGSGLKLATLTDSVGHFRVESLAMGSYSVRVLVPGFDIYTKKVILRPLQEYRLTAEMQLGTVGTVIEVRPAK